MGILHRGSFMLGLGLVILFMACGIKNERNTQVEHSGELEIKMDPDGGSLAVVRKGESKALVVQNAKPDFRPFLHPIASPDGNGVLTEYSPGHHKHQTGLYWGFTRVNGEKLPSDTIHKYFYKKDKLPDIKEKIGRDFFHHPEGDYWKRVSFDVLVAKGDEVSWQTVYHMLDVHGNPILMETQIWKMHVSEDKFFLDLDWQGKAITDITIGEFDYGGLFLRMPWKEGIEAEVVNAARQTNDRAEGQRAMWVDIGMQLENDTTMSHITIFDHPENNGFPQTWRVDEQFGVGPVRARMGDWHIKEGETEVIRHRIVAYNGTLDDMSITETWNDYIGSNSLYTTASLWDIAQEEGRNAKFLTPDEAVAEMTMLKDFEANAWAGEPMITQPIAFCWDDRGRLWVAENRDYESRGDGFSNSGDSRILILEDTDHDGTADTRKVFLEGIPFPSAIAVGFDGLFLGAPPNLLFVPDKNGDDTADEEDIEVLLTGWGIRDRHETINSFHWGPDGWLYGLEGFATPSKIRKPKGKGKIYRHKEAFPDNLLEAEGVPINGGVWRYHPTKKRFEVVAHGFSNPWGIDYDRKGQLFISACVIPHLFHVIPGGIYHRQGGQHFNPYVYSDIRTIVDHRHRSAHGGARIYQSDAFPEEHQNRLFMANIHEHAVLSDILEKNGSGFVAHHGDDFLQANNAQWIGFSMEIGPSGDMFVLDWHDADICGKEVLNKETGRIFRIAPKKSLAENWKDRYADLTTLSDMQLVALQESKSNWHARRARIVLQNRATVRKISEDARIKLKELFFNGKNSDHRLRAMWTLHITRTFSSDDLANALGDDDEYVRAWAIQMACEDSDAAKPILEQMVTMARSDPSATVRLYLAAALQRVEEPIRWRIAENLASRSIDSGDHNIPKMVWFGIEGSITKNFEMAAAFASSSKLPMLSEFTARRMVDADALNVLVGTLDKNPTMAKAMLKGMIAGLEGRSDIVAPDKWEAVYAKLKANADLEPLAIEVAQRFGDTEAALQFLTVLQNEEEPVNKRVDALSALASKKREELISLLPDLLEEPALRQATIRAMASFDEEGFGTLLIDNFTSFSPGSRAEALQTLSSRASYGRLLTEALKKGKIPKNEVPAYVARQLRRVVGNGFVEVWGPIDQLSEDKELDYKKYRLLLSDEALAKADLKNGKQMFERTCSACHMMYGQGGKVGPDITGSNRTNVDYLLNNLIEPSSEIQDDYRMVVITSRDGRTFSGNVIAENDRQITMRVIGEEELVLNTSEIQSRETASTSMMPEGLLETLSDKEVIDLIAFLKNTEDYSL